MMAAVKLPHTQSLFLRAKHRNYAGKSERQVKEKEECAGWAER